MLCGFFVWWLCYGDFVCDMFYVFVDVCVVEFDVFCVLLLFVEFVWCCCVGLLDV